MPFKDFYEGAADAGMRDASHFVTVIIKPSMQNMQRNPRAGGTGL